MVGSQGKPDVRSAQSTLLYGGHGRRARKPAPADARTPSLAKGVGMVQSSP